MPHHATVGMSEQHRLAIQECSMTVWDFLEKQWSSRCRLIHQEGIYESGQLNAEKGRGEMRRRVQIRKKRGEKK